VPIVGALRDILVVHKASHERSEGLVFGGDAPFQPSNVWRRAQRAWTRAGLQPIGLHEARHTFASILIAAGVNAKAITTYMGHASIQTTYDLYGKLMPGSEAEAAALVDAYLTRSDSASRIAQVQSAGS
jgi:integrase